MSAVGLVCREAPHMAWQAIRVRRFLSLVTVAVGGREPTWFENPDKAREFKLYLREKGGADNFGGWATREIKTVEKGWTPEDG